MRLLKEIGMWIWAILMLCLLAPIIYLDAWMERRERKRHKPKKFPAVTKEWGE